MDIIEKKREELRNILEYLFQNDDQYAHATILGWLCYSIENLKNEKWFAQELVTIAYLSFLARQKRFGGLNADNFMRKTEHLPMLHQKFSNAMMHLLGSMDACVLEEIANGKE